MSPAVRGKCRCRMHGGAAGSGAPRGNRNAFKHGFYTRAAIEERRQLRELVRRSRRLVAEIGVTPQPVARNERSEIRGGIEASSDDFARTSATTCSPDERGEIRGQPRNIGQARNIARPRMSLSLVRAPGCRDEIASGAVDPDFAALDPGSASHIANTSARGPPSPSRSTWHGVPASGVAVL
jgi:hypothetical protein